MKLLLLVLVIKVNDSIPFKILDYKKIKGSDSTWFYLKNMETGEKVYTKCCCKPYKKGTIRMVARKDESYFEERITNPIGH